MVRGRREGYKKSCDRNRKVLYRKSISGPPFTIVRARYDTFQLSKIVSALDDRLGTSVLWHMDKTLGTLATLRHLMQRAQFRRCASSRRLLTTLCINAYTTRSISGGTNRVTYVQTSFSSQIVYHLPSNP